MDPFYFRVRREIMGVPPGAIIASLPGWYVKQVSPELRDLPANYGLVLGAHLVGDLAWLEPITQFRVLARLPARRHASPPRTPRGATVGRALRLVP